MSIGISILTNGSRRRYLERCINSFIENCYYRPLTIGIFVNGCTDDTIDWLHEGNLPRVHGVEWRVEISSNDRGCAAGTNASIEMVSDCELQLHLESDFQHLPEAATGVDKMWLHRAVDHMIDSGCCYLYLRRIRDEREAAMHWWDQWMSKISEERGEYLNCPEFWWSNNPALFRLDVLKKSGVLPLDAGKDGPKGTGNWSQPELQAGSPPRAWLHRWGMFVHEVEDEERFDLPGCGKFGPNGHGCKYGFWKSGDDNWCRFCDVSKGYDDMVGHRKRLK